MDWVEPEVKNAAGITIKIGNKTAGVYDQVTAEMIKQITRKFGIRRFSVILEEEGSAPVGLGPEDFPITFEGRSVTIKIVPVEESG